MSVINLLSQVPNSLLQKCTSTENDFILLPTLIEIQNHRLTLVIIKQSAVKRPATLMLFIPNDSITQKNFGNGPNINRA